METQKHQEHEDSLSPELASALRMLGLGMPETVAEVAAAEQWLEQQEAKVPGRGE